MKNDPTASASPPRSATLQKPAGPAGRSHSPFGTTHTHHSPYDNSGGVNGSPNSDQHHHSSPPPKHSPMHTDAEVAENAQHSSSPSGSAHRDPFAEHDDSRPVPPITFNKAKPTNNTRSSSATGPVNGTSTSRQRQRTNPYDADGTLPRYMQQHQMRTPYGNGQVMATPRSMTNYYNAANTYSRATNMSVTSSRRAAGGANITSVRADRKPFIPASSRSRGNHEARVAPYRGVSERGSTIAIGKEVTKFSEARALRQRAVHTYTSVHQDIQKFYDDLVHVVRPQIERSFEYHPALLDRLQDDALASRGMLDRRKKQRPVIDVAKQAALLDEVCAAMKHAIYASQQFVGAYLSDDEKRYAGLNTHTFQDEDEKSRTFQYYEPPPFPEELDTQTYNKRTSADLMPQFDDANIESTPAATPQQPSNQQESAERKRVVAAAAHHHDQEQERRDAPSNSNNSGGVANGRADKSSLHQPPAQQQQQVQPAAKSTAATKRPSSAASSRSSSSRPSSTTPYRPPKGVQQVSFQQHQEYLQQANSKRSGGVTSNSNVTPVVDQQQEAHQEEEDRREPQPALKTSDLRATPQEEDRHHIDKLAAEQSRAPSAAQQPREEAAKREEIKSSPQLADDSKQQQQRGQSEQQQLQHQSSEPKTPQTPSNFTTVECPVCRKLVKVPRGKSAQFMLSQHMDSQCRAYLAPLQTPTASREASVASVAEDVESTASSAKQQAAQSGPTSSGSQAPPPVAASKRPSSVAQPPAQQTAPLQQPPESSAVAAAADPPTTQRNSRRESTDSHVEDGMDRVSGYSHQRQQQQQQPPMQRQVQQQQSLPHHTHHQGQRQMHHHHHQQHQQQLHHHHHHHHQSQQMRQQPPPGHQQHHNQHQVQQRPVAVASKKQPPPGQMSRGPVPASAPKVLSSPAPAPVAQPTNNATVSQAPPAAAPAPTAPAATSRRRNLAAITISDSDSDSDGE